MRRRARRRPAGAGRVAGVAAAGAWLAACGRDPLARMREQPRADPYEASRAFANGAVLQAPPAGTVARVSPNGTASDGTALDGAPPVTPALLAVGRDRYAIYCATCHGAAGYGGSVVAENMVEHRPGGVRSGKAGALTPAQLYAVTTYGYGAMPPFAAELTAPQRWAVAAYVVALRSAPAAGPAAAEDSTRAAGIARVDAALRARRDSLAALGIRDPLDVPVQPAGGRAP